MTTINRKAAYQNQDYPSKWLCWVPARKEWWIQNGGEDRGTESGNAHTTEGEDCMPWDPDAIWWEPGENPEDDWCEGEVRWHPGVVCLYFESGICRNDYELHWNGQYNLTEEVANEMPVYQHEDKSHVLACCEDGDWVIQHAKSRDGTFIIAPTHQGIYLPRSTPWDPDAQWKTCMTENSEWTILETRFMPEQVKLYGFADEACNGTFQITEEMVNEKLAYYNESTEKWLCCAPEGVWYIQSESDKGETNGDAFTKYSAPWLKEATWWQVVDGEAVTAENITHVEEGELLEAVIGKEFINGKGEDVSLEQLLAQGPKVMCIFFTFAG